MLIEGETMNKFKERFKKERKNKEITQKELADIFNADKSTISKYENGHNKPDLNLLIKYADFFGISTDYLLGRTNAKNASSRLVMEKEVAAILEEMIEDSQIIRLLKEIRHLSETDIEKILKIVKAFK